MLWDKREAAREAAAFARGVTLDEYVANRMLQRAVERDIEIIGEAACRVSAPYREAHPEIPWKAIIGQRNILVHDYGEILVERIYQVAAFRLEDLIHMLDRLLPDLPSV